MTQFYVSETPPIKQGTYITTSTGSGKMKQRDTHKLYLTTPCLIRRIRERIRECEKHNIDYEEYVERDYLIRTLETLDCCISFKDSKKIKRKEVQE